MNNPFLCWALSSWFLLLVSIPASSQTISTVAGGGVGDGGPAIRANIHVPTCVAVDAAGNLFIGSLTRVRKVAPGGTIETVAGNGEPGFDAFASVATSTPVNSPYAVAVDAAGNLYIAENRRVRKVTPSGQISIFAGIGVGGPPIAGPGAQIGDGGPAPQAYLYDVVAIAVDTSGNVYLSDRGAGRIRKISNGVITTFAGYGMGGFDGDDGPAAGASFGVLGGMAFDSQGNLYVVDVGNYRLRRIAVDGTITTVAGNGTIGSSGDGGLATDATIEADSIAIDIDDNIYLVGRNSVVRRIGADGIITTLSGAIEEDVIGIAADHGGNLFLASVGHNRVKKYVLATGELSVYAGTGYQNSGGDLGPATSATLFAPSAVAVADDGSMLIADTGNLRIRKVSPESVITTIAGKEDNSNLGEGGLAVDAWVGSSRAITIRGGDIYFSDAFNGLVRKISAAGVISTVAGGASAPQLNGDNGPATAVTLFEPAGIVFDGVGNLFIAETAKHRIRKVDLSGIITTVAGTGVSGFSGDGGPAIAAQLNGPGAMSIDSNGNIYFADIFNYRIRKLSADGIIQTIAGNGGPGISLDSGQALQAQLGSVSGIAVDSSRNLYVSVYGAVRKISPDGVITTIAGSGIAGFGGDGGPATSAALSYPAGLAVNARGDLFISDLNNSRIRKVTFPFGVQGLFSRKQHNDAVSYDLPLNSSSGTAGVEPRTGTRGHILIFNFNEPINSMGTVTSNIGSVSATRNNREVQVLLNGVPDNSKVSITIPALNGVLSVNSSLGFLLGDISRNFATNASDISALKTHVGKPVNERNFVFDLDLSGSIDLQDLAIAKSRSGISIP